MNLMKEIICYEVAYQTVYFTHYSGQKSMPLHLHFKTALAFYRPEYKWAAFEGDWPP
jgi:hypothetical protein